MQSFTLTFTREELGILGSALGELPYKHVKPLVDKIDQQLHSQLQSSKPPAEEIPENEA